MTRSSSISAFTKAASATGIVGAVAFSVLAGGMSASAAPINCAAFGATTIAPGICQIVVTTSGSFSVGAPVGFPVTHLEALLVGGGTAGGDDVGPDGYTPGYGSEVVYVDNVPLSGVTVTIGTGGTIGGTAATPTVMTDGATMFEEAGPSTAPTTSGAAGVLPSAFVAGANPASGLFPAFVGEQALAGDGVEGFVIDPATPAPDWAAGGGGTNGTFVNGRPNSGAGGGGANRNISNGDNIPGGNGAAGVVIFRFAAPDDGVVSPALAATGVDASTAAAAAGVLLLGGAAAHIAGRRRRARS